MSAPAPTNGSTEKPKSDASTSGGSKEKTTAAGPRRTYISNGQFVDSIPLTVRINRVITSLYNMGGLYVTSLLSLDPYTAAQNSQFNTRGPGRAGAGSAASGRRLGTDGGGGWFGWGGNGGGNNRPGNGGAGGGGGGGAGGRGSGRRMGTVDDVRGPECGSCG